MEINKVKIIQAQKRIIITIMIIQIEINIKTTAKIDHGHQKKVITKTIITTTIFQEIVKEAIIKIINIEEVIKEMEIIIEMIVIVNRNRRIIIINITIAIKKANNIITTTIDLTIMKIIMEEMNEVEDTKKIKVIIMEEIVQEEEAIEIRTIQIKTKDNREIMEDILKIIENNQLKTIDVYISKNFKL